jgi:hypothetical protein
VCRAIRAIFYSIIHRLRNKGNLSLSFPFFFFLFLFLFRPTNTGPAEFMTIFGSFPLKSRYTDERLQPILGSLASLFVIFLLSPCICLIATSCLSDLSNVDYPPIINPIETGGESSLLMTCSSLSSQKGNDDRVPDVSSLLP